MSKFCLVRILQRESFMFENIMPLSNAVEGYALFDNMKVQKGAKDSKE